MSRTIPLITDRLRKIKDHYKRCAFEKLEASTTHTVFWLKRTGNVREITSYGDAAPVFNPPIAVKAIIITDPTPQRESDWSPDERSTRKIYMLTSDFDSLGITNRDRMKIDDVTYQILDITREEGMGHETFATEIVLTPAVRLRG